MIRFLRLWHAAGQRRRTRPVPGVDDTGLIGWSRPPARAVTSPPPGPGRNPHLPVPGHRTPIAKRIHIHTCGCIWQWDGGTRRWERTYDCEQLDNELRKFSRDQH